MAEATCLVGALFHFRWRSAIIAHIACLFLLWLYSLSVCAYKVPECGRVFNELRDPDTRPSFVCGTCSYVPVAVTLWWVSWLRTWSPPTCRLVLSVVLASVATSTLFFVARDGAFRGTTQANEGTIRVVFEYSRIGWVILLPAALLYLTCSGTRHEEIANWWAEHLCIQQYVVALPENRRAARVRRVGGAAPLHSRNLDDLRVPFQYVERHTVQCGSSWSCDEDISTEVYENAELPKRILKYRVAWIAMCLVGFGLPFLLIVTLSPFGFGSDVPYERSQIASHAFPFAPELYTSTRLLLVLGWVQVLFISCMRYAGFFLSVPLYSVRADDKTVYPTSARYFSALSFDAFRPVRLIAEDGGPWYAALRPDRIWLWRYWGRSLSIDRADVIEQELLGARKRHTSADRVAPHEQRHAFGAQWQLFLSFRGLRPLWRELPLRTFQPLCTNGVVETSASLFDVAVHFACSNAPGASENLNRLLHALEFPEHTDKSASALAATWMNDPIFTMSVCQQPATKLLDAFATVWFTKLPGGDMRTWGDICQHVQSNVPDISERDSFVPVCAHTSPARVSITFTCSDMCRILRHMMDWFAYFADARRLREVAQASARIRYELHRWVVGNGRAADGARCDADALGFPNISAIFLRCVIVCISNASDLHVYMLALHTACYPANNYSTRQCDTVATPTIEHLLQEHVYSDPKRRTIGTLPCLRDVDRRKDPSIPRRGASAVVQTWLRNWSNQLDMKDEADTSAAVIANRIHFLMACQTHNEASAYVGSLCAEFGGSGLHVTVHILAHHVVWTERALIMPNLEGQCVNLLTALRRSRHAMERGAAPPCPQQWLTLGLWLVYWSRCTHHSHELLLYIRSRLYSQFLRIDSTVSAIQTSLTDQSTSYSGSIWLVHAVQQHECDSEDDCEMFVAVHGDLWWPCLRSPVSVREVVRLAPRTWTLAYVTLLGDWLASQVGHIPLERIFPVRGALSRTLGALIRECVDHTTDNWALLWLQRNDEGASCSPQLRVLFYMHICLTRDMEMGEHFYRTLQSALLPLRSLCLAIGIESLDPIDDSKHEGYLPLHLERIRDCI